jgi:DNA-binding CsgD family transcriptional regulator
LKRIVLFAAAGGLLIALLRFLEYQHLIRAYPGHVYGLVIAVIFTVVGGLAGLKWTARKETVVVREVFVPAEEPFVRDEEKVRAIGLTPRELEILELIGQGLSNREIGEKLFVSENTVKSHSSRLFEKLEVNRRTQAVRKAKELRLVP